jgi:hypothetical protein
VNVNIIQSDGNRPSVAAVDELEHLVAGAFLHGSYWHFYLTSTWADAIGVEFLPDHLPLFSKSQALHWVEVMAAVYCKAMGEAA